LKIIGRQSGRHTGREGTDSNNPLAGLQKTERPNRQQRLNRQQLRKLTGQVGYFSKEDCMKCRAKGGFTVVERMLVLALIGLLTAIVIAQCSN